MEYMVIVGYEYRKFLDDVTSMIEYRWKPQGGVCITNTEDVLLYSQAMIKE